MTQFARPSLNAAVDDGITLSTKFNGALPALYTNHAGAAAPPSPEKGQVWIDTSQEAGTPPRLEIKIYTGSVWRTTGTLNLTTGAYATAGNLPLAGGVMTGAIRGQDGTAALPGYSFSGNANLGMFRVGANSLGFSTAGVQRIALTGTSFDISVGTMSLSGAASTFNVDRSAGTGGWSQINWRTGTSNRFVMQMSGVESTGNAGGNFSLMMFDDAGTQIVNYLQINRATRNMGINGAAQAAATLSVRTNAVNAGEDAFDIMNTNSDVNGWVGMNFRTASGALRGAIRGERPGNNNGDLGVWTGAAGVLSRAATFRSGGQFETVGAVQAGKGVMFGDSAPWTTHRWRWRADQIGGIFGCTFNLNDIDTGYMVWATNIIQISLGSGVMNIADNVGGFWSVNLNASDRRLKDNVEPSTLDALSDIMRIPTFQFEWKRGAFGPVADTDETKPPQPIGFVTDTLKEIAPDCVNEQGTYEGVNLLPLVARLVRAVQQQQEMISSLESRLAALESPK